MQPAFDDRSEAGYQFVPATSGSVTVQLTGMSANLDLIVLENSSSGGCAPRTCKGQSSTASNESVTFTATAGTSYTIVVDGFAQALGTFTLSMSCP
jgi:hypothetical protein